MYLLVPPEAHVCDPGLGTHRPHYHPDLRLVPVDGAVALLPTNSAPSVVVRHALRQRVRFDETDRRSSDFVCVKRS